jgi:hypothetical protein
MSHYVRARHYSHLTGNWSTVDPLWPDESEYRYVGGRASKLSDPSGKWCYGEYGGPLPGMKGKVSSGLTQISGDPNAFKAFLECIAPYECQMPQKAPPDGSDYGFGTFIKDMSDNMPGKDKKCSPKDFEIIYAEGGWWPATNKCNDPEVCMWTGLRARPPRIHICQKNATSSRCGPIHCQLAHELLHAIGFVHNKDPMPYDCVKKLPGCENYNPTNIHPK